MSTERHPITPPPELVERLQDLGNLDAIALAYQAGADQELEACCEWMADETPTNYINALRAARRLKPTSLKEQAMRVLLESGYTLDGRMELEPEDIDIIHRALEQLND
jgi:hypothetical protein